jgi:hypothetical protein
MVRSTMWEGPMGLKTQVLLVVPCTTTETLGGVVERSRKQGRGFGGGRRQYGRGLETDGA